MDKAKSKVQEEIEKDLERIEARARSRHPALTPMRILQRLCQIFRTKDRCHLTADMIWQEQLVEVQGNIQQLMEDIGNGLPGGPELLAEKYPHIWKLKPRQA